MNIANLLNKRATSAAGADPACASADAAMQVDGLIWLGRRLPALLDSPQRLGRRGEAELREEGVGDASLGALARAFGKMLARVGLRAGTGRTAPDEQRLPMVALHPEAGVTLVYARAADGAWLVERPEGRDRIEAWPEGAAFFQVELTPLAERTGSAKAMFDELMTRDRLWIPLAALASTLASLLVLGTSFYSMQVYDRVIGQGGESTLFVLTAGVGLAILIELALKLARSAIMDRAVTRIDIEAATRVYDRLARVRLDQFPPNVGTLAAQVRGFETVRAYNVARAVYLWTDAPFALLFLAGIMVIGGPLLGLVPLAFLLLAIGGGLAIRRGILRHSAEGTLVGNRRQGMLVETVHGIEGVKAFGARWTMQARWNDLSRRSATETIEVKRLNEHAAHLTGLVQQLSYVGIVATGAYLAVAHHALTSGAIIACSILSGRALAPASTLPGLLVQWANAQVALESLDRLFALDLDNQDVVHPIVPDTVRGRFDVKDLAFAWPGMTSSIEIAALRIAAGEKVGVLGMVGAGKSTLLKLLAGAVRPRDGLVMLDGVDIQQICADRRAEAIGYLPQVSRLVSGTLRDNLTLGLPHVGDDVILEAAGRTGLIDHILARPQGLDLPIAEGGEGVSRGQKQLIGLTRVLIGRPDLWLLDEPTASMDDATEEKCLRALQGAIGADQTLVLVTHKLRLLELVDRLIVVTPRGIVLDGPRDAVLARLQQGNATAPAAPRVVSAVRTGAPTSSQESAA